MKDKEILKLQRIISMVLAMIIIFKSIPITIFADTIYSKSKPSSGSKAHYTLSGGDFIEPYGALIAIPTIVMQSEFNGETLKKVGIKATSVGIGDDKVDSSGEHNKLDGGSYKHSYYYLWGQQDGNGKYFKGYDGDFLASGLLYGGYSNIPNTINIGANLFNGVKVGKSIGNGMSFSSTRSGYLNFSDSNHKAHPYLDTDNGTSTLQQKVQEVAKKEKLSERITWYSDNKSTVYNIASATAGAWAYGKYAIFLRAVRNSTTANNDATALVLWECMLMDMKDKGVTGASDAWKHYKINGNKGTGEAFVHIQLIGVLGMNGTGYSTYAGWIKDLSKESVSAKGLWQLNGFNSYEYAKWDDYDKWKKSVYKDIYEYVKDKGVNTRFSNQDKSQESSAATALFNASSGTGEYCIQYNGGGKVSLSSSNHGPLDFNLWTTLCGNDYTSNMNYGLPGRGLFVAGFPDNSDDIPAAMQLKVEVKKLATADTTPVKATGTGKILKASEDTTDLLKKAFKTTGDGKIGLTVKITKQTLTSCTVANGITVTSDLQPTSKSGSLNNSGVTLKYTGLTKKQAQDFIDGKIAIVFENMITPANNKDKYTAYYGMEATWSIKNSSKEDVEVKCYDLTNTTTISYLAKDFASGYFNEETPETPFEYHSTENVDFYSEIKANACRNEDWEVLQGIPSTEELFIACGGQLFQVDVDGTTVTQTGISRKINFKVTVEDTWAVNTPCTLSCGGHSSSKSLSSPDATTSNGTTVTKTCSHCGTSYSATGKDAVPASGTPGEPGYTPAQPAQDASTSHSCDITATYNCSTGAYTGGGSAMSSNSGSATLTNGQYYKGYSETTDSDGCTTKIEWNQGVLDKGYTVGYGCSCSNTNNMIHTKPLTYNYSITENIDKIVYLNIKNYAIYGLHRADVTAINTSLLENGTGESVMNSLYTQLYDIVDSNGNYKNGNGRIFFTKWVNSRYKNGDGWNSSSAGAYYWLGDTTVNINVECDGKMEGPYASLTGHSISKTTGCDLAHYEAVDSTVSEYKTGQPGDRAEYAPATATAAVNSYMYGQGIANKYCANVISDSLTIGSDAGTNTSWQNIVASAYKVDDGVLLFGSPFTDAGSGTLTYDHACKDVTVDTLFNKTNNANYRSTFNPNDILSSGYQGNISPSYSIKYPMVGKGSTLYAGTRQFTKGVANDTIADSTYGNDAIFSYGERSDNSNDAGYAYANPAYFTNYSYKSEAVNGSMGYTGYYDSYSWPALVSTNAVQTKTGIRGNVGTLGNATSTNNSPVNYSLYGLHMVMSGFDIIDYVENGVYSRPVTVTGRWGLLLSKDDGPKAPNWPEEDRIMERTGKYFDNYTNYEGNWNVINDILIHDPVSTEFCEVLSMAESDPGKDQRVGVLEDTDANKEKYWVSSYDVQIFYSDFGNFYDSSGMFGVGSWSNNLGTGNDGDASTVSSNGIITNSGKGYMNTMDASRWTDERLVKFPCAVNYTDRNNRKITVPAFKWIDVTDIGGDSLIKSEYRMVNGKVVWGTYYKFNVTTSMVEVANSLVSFNSTAKNVNDNYKFEGVLPNNILRYSGEASHNAFNSDEVDLVGRIGNLAIEDSGDFRFAELFKQITGSNDWLIEGVIHNVDTSKPNKIVSDPKNIFGFTATDAVVNHTSQSVTYASLTNGTLIGKSGSYALLPLTPSDNTVEEYKGESMRMGYPLFMDVETLGNYYGVNLKSKDDSNVVIPQLDDTAEDGERSQYVDITPYYWLLNTTTREYTPIDVYYGEMGNRKLAYEFNGTKVDGYDYRMNWPEESARRNYTSAESYTTNKIYQAFNPQWGWVIPSLYSSDYIGNANKIRLDQANRTFIGSSILYGGLKVENNKLKAISFDNTVFQNTNNPSGSWIADYDEDGELMPEISYQVQGQRYHFTLTLPSTAYIVPHSSSDYYTLNNDKFIYKQKSIETAHDALLRNNPNSVIVCALDIVAVGDTWSLRYDGTAVNYADGGGIKIYPNGEVYPPPTGYETFPIVAVYDTKETSVNDLKTKGTH